MRRDVRAVPVRACGRPVGGVRGVCGAAAGVGAPADAVPGWGGGVPGGAGAAGGLAGPGACGDEPGGVAWWGVGVCAAAGSARAEGGLMAPRPRIRFPDVRITVFGDEDLLLSDPLDPVLDARLREIHDRFGGKGKKIIECREHDNDPELEGFRDSDGRVPGVWLFLREIRDVEARAAGNPDATRLVLCHWPRSGHKSHNVPRPETDNHIKGQDYVSECGDRVGYKTARNRAYSGANRCRADVRVFGPAAVMAAEIQVSAIETPSVLDRTRKAAQAGATSVWFPMMEEIPLWHPEVPCVGTNKLTSMAPRSWTVTTGVRLLEYERCQVGSRFDPCPVLGKGWCGRIHPLWAPWRGLTVDDVVEQFPGGGMVALDTRLDTKEKHRFVLTTPDAREAWLSFKAEVKTSGGGKRKQERPLRGPEGGLRHPRYSADKIRERLQRERVTRSTRVVSPERAAVLVVKCAICREAVPAVDVDSRGWCAFCADQVERSYLAQSRLCLGCRQPLPAAAIHLTYHSECAPPRCCARCGQRLLLAREGRVCEACRMSGSAGE